MCIDSLEASLGAYFYRGDSNSRPMTNPRSSLGKSARSEPGFKVKTNSIVALGKRYLKTVVFISAS
jgi:hypothetical protein